MILFCEINNKHYICTTKQKVNIMKAFNITTEIYRAVAEAYARIEGNCYWDCVEVAGVGVTFGVKDGRLVNVEVWDEDNELLTHDFSEETFARVAYEWDYIQY